MLPWLPLTWAQSLPNTVSGKIIARVTLVTWAQSLPDMIVSGKISSCYLGYLGFVRCCNGQWSVVSAHELIWEYFASTCDKKQN